MVKEPRAGRVKTRLGREIGMTAAAWWFRHQISSLLRRINDPRWELVLAITPDRAFHLGKTLARGHAMLPQGKGNLGARMIRAMKSRPGPVLVIGADIPEVRSRHLHHAFRMLGSADVVIGPATDGGYWLIGVRDRSVLGPNVLRGIRWSSAHALDDTIASLAGLRIAMADTLRDVDRAADLHTDNLHDGSETP